MQNMSNKIFIILILFYSIITSSQRIFAQSDATDIAILQAKIHSESTHQHSFVEIGSSKNLIGKILFGSLKFYKKNISQQISAECLYEISCSTFSQLALKEYGTLKGIALTADRLARCNRISGTTINEFRINENGKVIDTPTMYKLNND
jgi:putative component of membrane protein insertase Oxa1/YidC/SpoIIIJ protein YidD